MEQGGQHIPNLFSTWYIEEATKSASMSCLDKYSEVEFSEAITDAKLNTGGLIVYNNTKERKFAAAELGVKIGICGSFSVYTTKHKDLFFRIVDAPIDRFVLSHMRNIYMTA